VSSLLKVEPWQEHTAGQGIDDTPDQAFKNWCIFANKNKDRKEKKMSPIISLVEFNTELEKISR
jgi:hypothetical protein